MTEQEWLTSDDPESMLGFCESGADSRKMRLFCVACCRRIWGLIRDERSRSAVDASEAFADGLVSRNELASSHKIAMLGKRSLDQYVFPAERAAVAIARPKIVYPFVVWLTHAALGNHAVTTRGSTNSTAAAINHRLREEVKSEERKAQAGLLRCIFGNPFFPAAFDGTWRTPSVTALARAIYEERRFSELPGLADVLEESGRANQDILDHCRIENEHARGCWVLDLLLTNE